MATRKTMNTGTIPLQFAKAVSEAALTSFGDGQGEMMEKVSPITCDLLKYWFTSPFTERPLNFHAGQKQAILNVIYLHEVLGCQNIAEAYQKVAPTLCETGSAIAHETAKGKYAYPKYLVKMATGTGKTWVMHALLIWQYLNARAETSAPSGRWLKHFLFVAPGLIVYERLLDAFCGRRTSGEVRDFDTSDIKAAEQLFVPPSYRAAVFGFLQNAVLRKEDFGRKVVGDGVIAIMNWHTFLSDNDETEDEPTPDPEGKKLLQDLLPARPGTAAGNALESLDAQFRRGGKMDFLKVLPDLMLINDEAHHVHSGGKDDEAVLWQRGIDLLAKGKRFQQLDFSATPYETVGSKNNKREDYFPHIAVDFDLPVAMEAGLIKTISIDKRKGFHDLKDLDYNAIREDRKVISLSDGQRLMLRAGLARLKELEQAFIPLNAAKRPKMLVMCEDTGVTPFVEQFLLEEGLSTEDILRVDSNQKGEIGDKAWDELKERLFGMDKRKTPRVIVSVLMLREGFDVNNICVIVPLRASNSQILLEQTIGRGLRLMWREPEYQETKRISRNQLLKEKRQPDAYLDLLFIVEHPAFIHYYDKYVEAQLAGITTDAEETASTGIGDLTNTRLKEEYQQYDLFWPIILRESEDRFSDSLPQTHFKPFTLYPLKKLKKIFAEKGEVFIAKAMLVQTHFGEYRVNDNLFSADCYNTYLQRIIQTIIKRTIRINGKQTRFLPTLQINLAELAHIIDNYICTRLFDEPFNPFHEADWKVLLCLNGEVTKHIIKEVSHYLYELEQHSVKTQAEVKQIWFSSVTNFAVRESASLCLTKTIYTRTAYPSRSGGLERDFLNFIDHDSAVERFIKINEAKHLFARIAYLRNDGLLSAYIPDFLVMTATHIYLVETKADKDKHAENVLAKQKAALAWCKTINALPEKDRMARTWAYLLLTDNDFYAITNANGSFKDLTVICELTESGVSGEFNFS